MKTVPSTISWPPNQPSFALNVFLKIYIADCQVVEQNKYLLHNFCDYKTNYLKKFPQSFKTTATRAFTFLTPPAPSIMVSLVR